jgi:hypothetical protein
MCMRVYKCVSRCTQFPPLVSHIREHFVCVWESYFDSESKSMLLLHLLRLMTGFFIFPLFMVVKINAKAHMKE